MKKNNNIVIYIYMLLLCCAQSCLTLCSPMDYSLPASLVHGILQARILEWVVISSSRKLRAQTQVFCIPWQADSSLVSSGKPMYMCVCVCVCVYVCICMYVCIYIYTHTHTDIHTHTHTCISPNHFPIHLKSTQYCKSTVL